MAPSQTSNSSSKRLSGMFPWRRSVQGPPPSSRKSVYGSTSSFHNPGHFPVISEPVLEFSTADFIASADFRSAPEAPTRPVPNIHQYKPSQHVINTRNSVMLPGTSARQSKRLSTQSRADSMGSANSMMGLPSPHIDRRKSSVLISANTTSPLAAPNHSRDPTHAAVAASTMAAASAALNISLANNPANRRNSVASSLSRPGSMHIHTHAQFSSMTPVSPLTTTNPTFPSPPSSIDQNVLSPTDLKSKLQDSEQRAIDILIEYQQKLDKARKKIIDLEKRLQEESKAKRQLTAQAAQATAAAVVAQSSIRNTPGSHPASHPVSTPSSSQAPPTPHVKLDSSDDSDLTPASFLSSNNVVPPSSASNFAEADPNSIAYNNQNITSELVLDKMPKAELQKRVTALETQRETLRKALKSLRTAKDLESKQYQDQIARLKKQGAYQEFINQRQSAMLYNNPSPTSSTSSHQNTPVGQSPMYPVFPSPSFAPPTLKSSASFGSLPVSTALPSPRLPTPSLLGMSLNNNSNSSLKTESRLRVRRTGTAISPIFPTSGYPIAATPNSPIVVNARPKNKHQRSRSLFSNNLGLSAPTATQTLEANNKEFRNLSLYSNIKDEKHSLTYSPSGLSTTDNYNEEAEEKEKEEGKNVLDGQDEQHGEIAKDAKKENAKLEVQYSSSEHRIDAAAETAEKENIDLDKPFLSKDSQATEANENEKSAELKAQFSPSKTEANKRDKESPELKGQFSPFKNQAENTTNPNSSPASSSVTNSPNLSNYTFDSPRSELNDCSSSPNLTKKPSLTRRGSISSIASKSSVRGLIARYSIAPKLSPPSNPGSHSPQNSTNGFDGQGHSGVSRKVSRSGSNYLPEATGGGSTASHYHTNSYDRTQEYTQKTHTPQTNHSETFTQPERYSLTNMNGVNVRASVSEYAASIHNNSYPFKQGTHVLSGSENSINSQNSAASMASTNMTMTTSTTDSEFLTDVEMLMDNHTASSNTSMSVESPEEGTALSLASTLSSLVGHPHQHFENEEEEGEPSKSMEGFKYEGHQAPVTMRKEKDNNMFKLKAHSQVRSPLF